MRTMLVAALGAGSVLAVAACRTGFEAVGCEETLTCAAAPKAGDCDGECVPQSPFPDGLLTILLEQATDADACPPETQSLIRGSLQEPPESVHCPTCACTDASCELPPGVTATTAFMCGDEPGAVLTPFEAPAGWDGGCVAPAPVPPELFGSIAIPPPTVRPCAPVGLPVPNDGDAGGFRGHGALVCYGGAQADKCPDASEMCFPSQARLSRDPSGGKAWLACVQVERDDIACVDSYPMKRTVHWNIEDTRACADCACTPVREASCAALVSTYEDAACGELVDMARAELGGGACHDPLFPMSLGSLSASWIENEPGLCVASGGELTGTVTYETSHFCCRALEP